ncbi:hypothetical protein VQH23_12630 [Pararoseomonas sp. SCSIO 73927]|uniref:hypothetical protein n=1 Tax=Pararoseomonas sp. SCSIO 73927 TaxID=3114537 RepID=UPI0030D20C84
MTRDQSPRDISLHGSVLDENPGSVLSETQQIAIGLADAIALFDRRERRAVADMLGGRDAVRLSRKAADTLGTRLGVPPAELVGSPWHMDYTWNWLAGALTLYGAGSPDPRRNLANSTGLVEHNQEDVDALVVAGTRLVLIEAKWQGRWSRVQLESKARRIQAFAALAERIGRERELRWHLALASRDEGELLQAARTLEALLGPLAADHPVVRLPLAQFVEKLPTGLLDVPYVKKGNPWSIAASRRWRASGRTRVIRT